MSYHPKPRLERSAISASTECKKTCHELNRDFGGRRFSDEEYDLLMSKLQVTVAEARVDNDFVTSREARTEQKCLVKREEYERGRNTLLQKK